MVRAVSSRMVHYVILLIVAVIVIVGLFGPEKGFQKVKDITKGLSKLIPDIGTEKEMAAQECTRPNFVLPPIGGCLYKIQRAGRDGKHHTIVKVDEGIKKKGDLDLCVLSKTKPIQIIFATRVNAHVDFQLVGKKDIDGWRWTVKTRAIKWTGRWNPLRKDVGRPVDEWRDLNWWQKDIDNIEKEYNNLDKKDKECVQDVINYVVPDYLWESYTPQKALNKFAEAIEMAEKGKFNNCVNTDTVGLDSTVNLDAIKEKVRPIDNWEEELSQGTTYVCREGFEVNGEEWVSCKVEEDKICLEKSKPEIGEETKWKEVKVGWEINDYKVSEIKEEEKKLHLTLISDVRRDVGGTQLPSKLFLEVDEESILFVCDVVEMECFLRGEIVGSGVTDRVKKILKSVSWEKPFKSVAPTSEDYHSECDGTHCLCPENLRNMDSIYMQIGDQVWDYRYWEYLRSAGYCMKKRYYGQVRDGDDELGVYVSEGEWEVLTTPTE